jgi:hypothetical protein
MQPTTPALPMSLERWRVYSPVTKSYSGWYAGKRLTRKLVAELSGVSVQFWKAHDRDPSLRIKPHILRKLAKFQLSVDADKQVDMLDHKAEIAAARAAAKLAAKAEAEKQRALDKLLDRALKGARKLSGRARQGSVFG